jgi:hypothetical protein
MTLNTKSTTDYTEGLSFFAWLWKRRKLLIAAFLLNIFFGYKAYEAYLEYGEETPTLIASIFFGLGVPIILAFLTVREYLGRKRGIIR